MSRKSRIGEDEKANWSTIKHWTLTRSYSEYRPLDKVPKGTLVIVTHRRGGGDEGANHPLMLAAPDAGLSGGKGSAQVGVERALQAGLISLQQRDALLKEL